MEECPRASIRRNLLRDTDRSEGIGKAAWQLEDAMNGRLLKDYPSDLKARECYFDWALANQRYGTSIALLYFVSMTEVPAWCDNISNFWNSMDASARCQVPGVRAEDLLLSGVPYIPPAWTLVLEGVLVFQIGAKLLQERHLQVEHFSPLHVEYFGEGSNRLLNVGLAMVVFEVFDMLFFILFRPAYRLAFIPRTVFMVLRPQVLALFASIADVIQEFVTIAVFFVSGVLIFAWIATMLFDGVEEEIYGESVTEGLETFSKSVNTMFIAGATDDFFEMARNTYSWNRVSGILWLIFLVIVHVLFLSLVLDTLVSSYTKLTEDNEEEENKEKVDGIRQAFKTLCVATHDDEVSRDVFLEFARSYSKSPRTLAMTDEQALIIFQKVDEDGNHRIDVKEFFKLCAAMQLQFTVTIRDSPVKDALPWVGKTLRL